MPTVLEQTQREAYVYLKKLSSIQVMPVWTLLEVKHKREKFAEALVLLRVNPTLSAQELSDILDYNFTPDRMEVLADFWMRDIFYTLNKPKGGAEILSPKQEARRRERECFGLMDELDYGAQRG